MNTLYKHQVVVCFFASVIFLCGEVLAQGTSKAGKNPSKEVSLKLPETVEKKASVRTQGEKIDYTVRAGFLTLKNPKQEDEAHIFYIAYTRDGLDELSSRPVTFSFNGGPGSSSVWLHMGVFGPKKASLDKEGKPALPPYGMEDNPHSWLKYSDFVFIDPVSTGYSRAANPDKPDKFHSFSGDIESVGDFIRRYLSENGRWGSPKFIAGESYGTTRASYLTNYLMREHGVFLNGTILVSNVMNFQTLRHSPQNDLPYIAFFPSYTATAWYYQQLPEELQNKTLEEVCQLSRDFVETAYVQALIQGSAISARKKGEIAEAMAQLTGLDKDYILKSDLRINPHYYRKALLKADSTIIGRFDSRYHAKEVDMLRNYPEFDPSSELGPTGPFSTQIKDYLTRDLGLKTDIPYEILNYDVHPWNWDKAQNQFLNTAPALATTMKRNPHMKVWFLNGYYDLATPFYGTEYTLSHLWLPKAIRENIQLTWYEAGHMMYVRQQCLEKMFTDAKKFYESALPAKE